MRPGKLIGRLATLTMATVGCLVVALLVPLIYNQRASDEPFVGASVMASPRDMHVVTHDIRLSSTPDLVLARGALYADGNAALGTPISRFVLDAPVFTLATSAVPAADAVSSMEAAIVDPAPLVDQLAAMSFDALTIRRGTLNITSGDGSAETLSEIEAEISGRRKGQITARGSFSYRGQRISFDTVLAQPGDKKTAQQWPFKATLKSAFVDANLEGNFDVARELQVTGLASLTVPSLRHVARWFSIPVPNAEGLNAASLRGQFAWTRRSLALEQAKVTVDGNEGSGTLSLILSGERPLVDGTLAFGAIDLLPYYESLRPQTFGFERTSTNWANLDLSFPLIRYVDTDLRISTPKVTFKGFNLGRTAATLTVRSGKLLADIAELELGTGTASLQLTANTADLVPRYALKGKLDNIDLSEMAGALLAGSGWSGKGTLNLDLAGVGQAPIEVLRTLSGRASLQMAAGARVPFDAKGVRAAAKAAPVSGWPNLAKGQVQFDQFDVRAAFTNGVAGLETQQVRAGANALALSGRLNLADGEMDLRLANRASAPIDRPSRTADFLGADVMRLHGPLRSPTLSVEDPAIEPGQLPAPVLPDALPN